MFCFFFKQKTAYEMRISDWSSDVCSSDLLGITRPSTSSRRMRQMVRQVERRAAAVQNILRHQPRIRHRLADGLMARIPMLAHRPRGEFEIAAAAFPGVGAVDQVRSEERRVGKE